MWLKTPQRIRARKGWPGWAGEGQSKSHSSGNGPCATPPCAAARITLLNLFLTPSPPPPLSDNELDNHVKVFLHAWCLQCAPTLFTRLYIARRRTIHSRLRTSGRAPASQFPTIDGSSNAVFFFRLEILPRRLGGSTPSFWVLLSAAHVLPYFTAGGPSGCSSGRNRKFGRFTPC